MDVASGADRHLHINFYLDCRYRVVKSTSLVSVLFTHSHNRVGMCIFVQKKFVIGRAKRAPHWGVQSRFRVIYIYQRVR